MNLSQQSTPYHPIWVLTAGTLSVSTSRSPRSLCPFLCSPAPPQHAGVFCPCLMSIKSNMVGTYLRMQQVRNLMPSKAVKPHTQIHHIVVTFHHFHPQIIRSETWTSFKIQQNLRVLRILAGPNYRDPLRARVSRTSFALSQLMPRSSRNSAWACRAMGCRPA